MKSLYQGFLTLLKDYIFNRLSYTINYPLVKPWRINFDITYNCPLHCRMCNIWKEKVDHKHELKLKELKRIIDEVHEWGIDHISFAGGETLTKKRTVIELTRYARSKNIRVDLITNGVLLDKKTAKTLLESDISKISLSVDGAKEKTHDSLRGKGSFKKVINAAKMLTKLKNKMKSSVELEFTTVVCGINFRELVDVFHLMESLSFNYINYQVVVPDNTFSMPLEQFHEFYNSPLWIKEKDLPEFERITKKLVLLKKKTGKIRNTRRYLLTMPQYFKEREKFKTGMCIVGYSYININPYGFINVCGLGPNINVKEGRLKKLWKDKRYKLTRIRIKKCKRPCLMLCYEKLNLKELIEAWLELRGLL
ncbi:MAG: radical SAM protein [Candidatus Aenigmarchaeota archaeon]|nr:radical SAM protein [Candidatus Aenigmarchaeota archaeon]